MHVRTFQKLLRAVIAASAIVSAPMGDAFAYWKQPAFSIQASCIVHDLDWDFIPVRPLTSETANALTGANPTELMSATLELDRCLAAAKRYEFQKQFAAAWSAIGDQTTNFLNSSIALTAQYSRWRDAWVSRIQNPGPTLAELIRTNIVADQQIDGFANNSNLNSETNLNPYQPSPSDRVSNTSTSADNDDLLVGFDWNCHELKARPTGMMLSGKYANIFVYQFESQTSQTIQEPTNESSSEQSSLLFASHPTQDANNDPADIGSYIWHPGVDPICTEVNAPNSFLSWRNLYAPHTCLIAQPQPFIGNEIAQTEIGVCTPVDTPIQYSLADHGAGHCIIPTPNEVALNEFPIVPAPVVEHPVIADASSVATFGTFENAAPLEPSQMMSAESEPSPLPSVYETIPVVEVSQSVPSLAVEELPPANYLPSEVIARSEVDNDSINVTTTTTEPIPSQQSILIDSPPTSYEYDTWYDSPQFEEPTIDAIPIFETTPTISRDLVTDPEPTLETTPTTETPQDIDTSTYPSTNEAPGYPVGDSNGDSYGDSSVDSSESTPTGEMISTPTYESGTYQPEPYQPVDCVDGPISSSPNDYQAASSETNGLRRDYGDWLADIQMPSSQLWCFPNSVAMRVHNMLPTWNWNQFGDGLVAGNRLVVGAHRKMIEELSINAVRISRSDDLQQSFVDTTNDESIVNTASNDWNADDQPAPMEPMLTPMIQSAKVALWSGMRSYEPATYNIKHQAAEQLAKQLNAVGTSLIQLSYRIQQVTDATELARRATESFRSTQ